VIRPDLADIQPYRWQEGWESAVPEGVPVLRLDQNTQPRSPRWYAGAAARLAAVPVHSYPDSRYGPLREAIAAYAGFPPEQVVPTAGADEALILCALLALSPGERAYARRPHYAMFENATRLAGGVLADEPEGARLTWICTPHNPTGADMPDDALERRDGLVVVDQAYVEFGGEDLAPLIADHPNLIVARTLSKGWALASLRVGYALASPAIAGALDALRPPGSLSLQSAVAAELALDHVDGMRADVAAYVAERGRMRRGIAAAGGEVLAEAGPFVTFRTPLSSDEAWDRLAADGLVVRTFGHEPLLAGVIRATVQTPPETDRLVSAVAELCGREPLDPEPVPAEHDYLWGRRGTVGRRTRETAIEARLVIDGSGRTRIRTGIAFLDHMLHALAFHACMDLDLDCAGDLEVDEHHTVEDCGIALGQALDRALGDRAGIRRFGDAAAPLDEALARCTVDLGGRGVSAIDLALTGAPVGGVAASLWPHMLDSFARAGRLNLHLESRGSDDHHVVEAAFKALARALREACERDPRRQAVPSTKGAL
jgi:imidazoleglycerol phosphate dehydratase HisB/histidinol-phosphate/aromatic aminotransferase/cobyric acid decarboxylase-like protein